MSEGKEIGKEIGEDMRDEEKEVQEKVYNIAISEKEAFQLDVWLEKIINPHVLYSHDKERMMESIIKNVHWVGFYIRDFLKEKKLFDN